MNLREHDQLREERRRRDDWLATLWLLVIFALLIGGIWCLAHVNSLFH